MAHTLLTAGAMSVSLRRVAPSAILCLIASHGLLACSVPNTSSDPFTGFENPGTGAGRSPTSPTGPAPSPMGQPVSLEPEPQAADGDGGAPRTDIVVRTTQSTSPSSAESAVASAPVGTRTLFLNRNGGTYYPGTDNSSNNTSSIISAAVQAPPWSRTDAEWQALLAGAQAAYAPYNVFVTDQDPGAAPHVEVVVSGNPTMIGEPSWTAGISPMAPAGEVIERAICWVFDTQLQGTADQVRVVTHEAAHAYGLDHEFYCPNTMSYLFDCPAKSFEDSAEYCGEYAARTCASGGSTQDSVQSLLSSLGPSQGTSPPPSQPPSGTDAGTTPGEDAGPGADAGPPGAEDGGSEPGQASITLVSPDDGATATGNQNFNVVAEVANAVRVILNWELNGTVQTYDCAAMPQGMSCAQSGGQVTWTLDVGTGPRSWYVEAIDANGNSTTSETRSLVLVAGSSSGGTVSFTTPNDGDSFNPGDNVTVNVDTGATAGVNAVWLTWTAPTAQVQYPLTYLGGSAWGLTVSTSTAAVAGDRTLTATAYDASNNPLAQSTLSVQIQ